MPQVDLSPPKEFGKRQKETVCVKVQKFVSFIFFYDLSPSLRQTFWTTLILLSGGLAQ